MEGYGERVADLRAAAGRVDEMLAQAIVQELDEIAQGKAGDDTRVAARLSALEAVVEDVLRKLAPPGDEDTVDLETLLARNKQARGVCRSDAEQSDSFGGEEFTEAA